MKSIKVLSLAVVIAAGFSAHVFAATTTTNVGATMTIVAAPTFGAVTDPALGNITFTAGQAAQVNTDGTAGGNVDSMSGQTAGNVTVSYGANAFNSLVVTTSTNTFTMANAAGDTTIDGTIGIVLTAAAGATIGTGTVNCDAAQTTCPISIGAATAALAAQGAGAYSTGNTNGATAVLTLTYS